MKAEMRPRPQSKHLVKEARPTSRYANTEQARQFFQKAKVEQQTNCYDKAIDIYLRATMYDPDFYQAYCNIGACYRSLGRYM